MKIIHTWISGIKLNLIEERHPIFRNLTWVGEIPPSYSVHTFTLGEKGIISLSDAFGGKVAWARFEGKNPLIGKIYEGLDKEETDFLSKKYPAFLEAINSL